MATRGDVTRLLAYLCAGREKAREKLIPLLYEEPRSLAGYCIRRQKPRHTVQTTALVYAAYLKLVGDSNENWESRAHFMKDAARALGISESTVKREWRVAKAWLRNEMTRGLK